MENNKLEMAELLSQFKKEFMEILRIVIAQQETYPITFKAVMDKNGRITIPFAERKTEGLESDTIVQIKMRIVPTRTAPN